MVYKCCNEGPIVGPIVPFNFWTAFTPVVPDVYKEAISPQQQIHDMCCMLHKLVCYSDMLASELNIDKEKLQELSDLFEKFQESGFEDYYAEQIHAWVNANVANIFNQYAKLVLFGLNDEGYFVAYVPESWSDIWFDTIADYSDPLYGRLVLLWDGNGNFSNPTGPANMPTNYERLSFKPSINGVTLLGDKTFEELGLVPMTEQEVIDV